MKRILVLLSLFVCVVSSCTKEVFTPVPYPVEVHDTLTLQTGAISGIIKNAGDVNYGVEEISCLPLYPLDSVKVDLFLTRNDSLVSTMFSDRQGLFTFANLPEGEYKVKLEKTYSPKEVSKMEMSASVKKGETTVLSNYFFDCVLFLKKQPEKKPWTFIHFVNATDNNIYAPMVSTIRIFERYGGSSAILNDVAYMSTGRNVPMLYYLMKPNFVPENERFYDFNFVANLYSPKYVFNPNQMGMYEKDGDPGDYRFLKQMILNIAELYPSDSVALFISDHGSGIDMEENTKSISINTENLNTITMPQLRTVLEDVKDKANVQLLVFDACFMGMYEVAYELKDVGLKYIMASSLPSSAFFQENIISDPPVTLEEFNSGRCSIDKVCHELIAKHGSSILSLYDMQHIDDLTALFNDFASKINQTPVQYTEPIIYKTTKMADTDPICSSFMDMGHFAKLISETHFSSDPAGLVASAKALYEYLSVPSVGKFINDMKNNQKDKFPDLHGVSVLLPAPKVEYAQTLMDIYRKHKYYLDGNKDWDEYMGKIDWDLKPEEWNGSIQKPAIVDGNYMIYHASELAWVADQVNKGEKDFASEKVIQINDLDLGGKNKQNWIPIGSAQHPFKGSYDGGGFAIRNFYLGSLSAESVGLFGFCLDGEIKNVTVDGLIEMDLSSAKDYENIHIGGLCGMVSGASMPAKISSCFGGVQIKLEKNASPLIVGSFVGIAKGNVDISDCKNDEWLSVTEAGNPVDAGGICGRMQGSSNTYSSIIHCFQANGYITLSSASSSLTAGGICGSFEGENNRIYLCENNGSVKTTNSSYCYSGGIVGTMDEGNIYWSTSIGDVEAKGTGTGEYQCSYAGGICASGNGNISSCASSGNIVSGKYHAGIMGFGSGVIASCSSSTVSDMAGILGKVGEGQMSLYDCYYASTGNAVGGGTPSVMNNCHKYSESAWPTSEMKGWGDEKSEKWGQWDWSNPWETLGSWNVGTPNYPKLKFKGF